MQSEQINWQDSDRCFHTCTLSKLLALPVRRWPLQGLGGRGQGHRCWTRALSQLALWRVVSFVWERRHHYHVVATWHWSLTAVWPTSSRHHSRNILWRAWSTCVCFTVRGNCCTRTWVTDSPLYLLSRGGGPWRHWRQAGGGGSVSEAGGNTGGVSYRSGAGGASPNRQGMFASWWSMLLWCILCVAKMLLLLLLLPYTPMSRKRLSNWWRLTHRCRLCPWCRLSPTLSTLCPRRPVIRLTAVCTTKLHACHFVLHSTRLMPLSLHNTVLHQLPQLRFTQFLLAAAGAAMVRPRVWSDAVQWLLASPHLSLQMFLLVEEWLIHLRGGWSTTVEAARSVSGQSAVQVRRSAPTIPTAPGESVAWLHLWATLPPSVVHPSGILPSCLCDTGRCFPIRDITVTIPSVHNRSLSVSSRPGVAVCPLPVAVTARGVVCWGCARWSAGWCLWLGLRLTVDGAGIKHRQWDVETVTGNMENGLALWSEPNPF